MPRPLPPLVAVPFLGFGLTACGSLIGQLELEDQLIVQLHFAEGNTVADVARALRIEQKPLYRRVERLRVRLRALLESAGLSGDDVRGLLDLRRLAEPIARGQLRPDTRLEPYLLPVSRVEESASLADLLPLIRSGKPLLVVVDEHGGTEGIVTVEDLIEEGLVQRQAFSERKLAPGEGKKKLAFLSFSSGTTGRPKVCVQ